MPRAQRLECALLKGVAARYVMGRESHGQTQALQREIVAELAAALVGRRAGPARPGLPRLLRWRRPTTPARLRVIVDQLASLTDTAALAWHATSPELRAGSPG